ncbi:hypothetical protein [Nocardia sp. NPDC052112]|uniref:hypothetical protein n=1 Tax=Nocardia sp. NPDC052112 TaxID=3155646 RepID=UPI003442C825
MFEQRERWLEEMHDHVDHKESVTSTTGHMNLVAITAEIADACADERKQKRIHIPNWQSMARDLEDTLDYLGAEAAGAVRSEVTSLVGAINNDLLYEKLDDTGRMQTCIDNDKRPQVTKYAAALLARLDSDDVLVAAWRDLLAGCQDSDHVAYPYDRIAFFRDNVIALQEHRRQDPGYWGSTTTAVEILFDIRHSVARAQSAVGDYPIDFDPQNQSEPTGLTDEERMNLAERWIVRPPRRKDIIVWFRIANAYVLGGDCVSHGDVTFYPAQVLAGVIIDHDVARAALSVVPEELLTDKISQQQSTAADVNKYDGLEHLPGLVYVRVLVRDIESHRAVAEARAHLQALLAVLESHEDMWVILKGYLVFDGRYNPRPLAWGPKQDREPTIFHENDYVADDLRMLNDEGHVITLETARRLQPVLQLAQALESASRSDPEAVVMAAVRAIEHCNSWTTKGRKEWGEFIDLYLRDEFTRIAFLRRATEATFDAIIRELPDKSPGATPQPLLRQIHEAVSEGSWGRRFDRQVAIEHIAALKAIYADHPLVRRLSELDDILAAGSSISAAFDTEQRRVEARVARLTRSRNAAIHGGPLSKAACDSIVDFAFSLASQALHNGIRAIITGETIADYMRANRTDNEQRVRILRRTGDLKQFYIEAANKS